MAQQCLNVESLEDDLYLAGPFVGAARGVFDSRRQNVASTKYNSSKNCEHLSLTLKRRYWAALPRKRTSFSIAALAPLPEAATHSKY